MSLFKHMRDRVFAALHRGERFTCVFCGRRFSRFLPAGSRSRSLRRVGAVGIGRRPDARCPGCGSSDRARLLYLYLRDHTDVFTRPLRLLHIAPNLALAAKLRESANINYVCGSIDPDDFRELGAVAVDVMRMPFTDASFDVVLCNHVLQQVPDDMAGLREIHRVLKPGGWAVAQSPVATAAAVTDQELGEMTPRARRRRFGSTLHFRLYGRDYADRLRAAGLTPEIVEPGRVGAPADAINPLESIYVARKGLAS